MIDEKRCNELGGKWTAQGCMAGETKVGEYKRKQHGKSDFTPEIYKGYVITFEKRPGGWVGARAPERTSQYIGSGKGKKEAFEDVKKTIDLLEKKKTVEVGDKYQGLVITEVYPHTATLVGINEDGEIKRIKWEKDQWLDIT